MVIACLCLSNFSFCFLQAGEVIKVIRKKDDGTWFGELNDRTGNFPFNYVSKLPSDGSQWNGL